MRSPKARCGSVRGGPARGAAVDIGHAVESYVRQRGDYGIVEEYVGHGIGTACTSRRNVPNYGQAGRGPELCPGWCSRSSRWSTSGSRQPGSWRTAGPWSRRTAGWSAHFEHTFTLTPDGPWVLTALDGGRARLGRWGRRTSLRADALTYADAVRRPAPAANRAAAAVSLEAPG